MIEIIQGWEKANQQAFASLCIVGCVVIAWRVLAEARIALRGYPPIDDRVVTSNCGHPDNLTELCIKPTINCATREECEKEIQRRKDEA